MVFSKVKDKVEVGTLLSGIDFTEISFESYDKPLRISGIDIEMMSFEQLTRGFEWPEKTT